MYKYTKAYNYRGANMGRPDIILDTDYAGKAHLQRVNLYYGGYDKGGAYWGYGQPLFVMYFEGKEKQNEMFVRADNREQAKLVIKESFPNIKFYR